MSITSSVFFLIFTMATKGVSSTTNHSVNDNTSGFGMTSAPLTETTLLQNLVKNEASLHADLNRKVDTLERQVQGLVRSLAVIQKTNDALQSQNKEQQERQRNIMASVKMLTVYQSNEANITNRKLSNITQMLEKEVQTKICEPQPKLIAFLSRTTKVLSGQTGKAIFDKVDFNYGDCYDVTTGVFIASVNGLYSFSVTIEVSIYGIHGYVSHNGAPVLQIVSSRSKPQSVSSSIALQLQIGDRVWFEWQSNGEQHSVADTDSFFCGFMIRSLSI